PGGPAFQGGTGRGRSRRAGRLCGRGCASGSRPRSRPGVRRIGRFLPSKSLSCSLPDSIDRRPLDFSAAVRRTRETARPFVVRGGSSREIMIERANPVRNDSSRSPDVQPERLPVLMKGQVNVRKPERHPGQSHNPQSDGQQNQSWLQQQHRVSDEPKQVSFPLNRNALGAVQVRRKSERVEEQSRIYQREDRHPDHGQGNLERIGPISPDAKRGNRKNRRNVKIAILVPTRVTTRLTSRLA